MKIIDLSQPIFNGMPVYPGDPGVVIKEIHTLEKEGWNLRNVSFTTHIGTHVNVPYHMNNTGKRLDLYDLDRFIGKAELYTPGMKYFKNKGVTFSSTNITKEIADQLIAFPPKFIGLSEKFEFDIALEKLLLDADIISFENLTNTDKLPASFNFYGVPLNIKESDGSPVRAFAIM
ncbi:cyclase [Candidatus Roizmanbacteria bacterium CG_4_10_14_0_8_um_filter_39_9]|uniref:Cyclase n=1 Tax=Candidatus Roizmanbacteria bacterium CG_4_10_14_0_8_um_filter_39_9 TaxID=1974829 RepID=A0A2M7QC90_9BACT|nr:MAG: cyclase [Candidatus Roizmanbacteria bacterium CG_4_10_14_0_8_um_filter_39_9]